MMSNNDYSDLSGLSRDELLQLVVAQQSQLRTHQHHQTTNFSGLTQQRSTGLTAASLLQDRLLAQQSLGAGTSASLGGGQHLSSLLAVPRAATSGAGMADFYLRRRAAGLTAPSHQADPVSAASATDLFQARRLASSLGASAQMREFMLRQELLGTSSAGGSNTLAPGSYSTVTHNSTGTTDLPSEGSNEDIILRRLITGTGQPRPAAAVAVHQPQTSSRGSFTFGSAAAAGTNTPSPHEMTTEILLGMSSSVHGARVPPTTRRVESHPSEAVVESKAPGVIGVAGKNAAPVGAAAAAAKKKTKRPLSAYNIFFKEEHAKIIAQNEREKAEKQARGESINSDDDYCDSDDENAAVDVTKTKGKKRKRSLSTNQPGKRGKRQVDFENLTKVIGRRWKELPSERVEEYKRRAEEAMQAYRKNLFQKIRNSVKEDQA
ncbi:expressed unknown protein [Seminavis robusta]|uniref:HMG box domain-containing protein n=1 Tax=Seminavis robusta TaxID=568900 RepID=A0A9N8HQX1_9STRA|nr:expressed unknown protein [Seminavis robusta]|eukprot:Sro1247_g255890.1 n/a (434) ;mRNA; r:19403-20704